MRRWCSIERRWHVDANKMIPGALTPMGLFDPLRFAEKADEPTLKRCREAELAHGRVSMLALVDFLVGKKVEGSSFLFDAQITGTAFWVALTIAIGAAEQKRATTGWVEPENVPVSKPELLRDDCLPGNLGFNPLGLSPEGPA
jgi:hypothetical protein